VVAVAEVLSERYEFVSRIAAGGMGEVWRGRDRRLQRDVAIKVLRAEHADDPDFRSRLHAEAQAAGALNCDAVVDIYDYGEQTDDAGRFLSYVVMELVDGDTVAALLARDGAIGPERTARIVSDTAAGLAAAHERGLVHRDIKPANLLMTREGRVKVADFGIARAANGLAITRAGTMVGTATYVAPEQVQGKPATSASDVYSLGILAHECLSGVPPYRGDGEIATALARVNVEAPALPASVPLWLAALVTAMLDPDPDRRPSAAEVARRTGAGPVEVPTQVVPIVAPPVPTVALPAPTTVARPTAAETTDLDVADLDVVGLAVPASRRELVSDYVRQQPTVMVAVLGLIVLALVVPSLTSAMPSPLRTETAAIAAATSARAAAPSATSGTAATTQSPAATQGQDAVTAAAPAPAAVSTSTKHAAAKKKPRRPHRRPARHRHSHSGHGHGPGSGHSHGRGGHGDGHGHGSGDDD
jgi:hypothetical protein